MLLTAALYKQPIDSLLCQYDQSYTISHPSTVNTGTVGLGVYYQPTKYFLPGPRCVTHASFRYNANQQTNSDRVTELLTFLQPFAI